MRECIRTIFSLINILWIREIEVNYDRLKNKMEIENYTGKSEIIIKQDFYSSIYIFNLAMILKNNIQKHLERKNKKKTEKRK